MDRSINMISSKIGYLSSLASLFLWLVFTVCFVSIFATAPVFRWTNISDYIVYNQTYNQTLKYVAQTSMFLFGPAFILVLSSINEQTVANKKIFSKIGLLFGQAFMALSCVHYFVQLTTVRQNILSCNTAGLEHFIQSNPLSFILALNMLGWTYFLGLTSLFIAPVFYGNRLEKIIRYGFIINGILCLLGGIGFILQNIPLIIFTINFGMGGAMMVILISMMVYFRKKCYK